MVNTGFLFLSYVVVSHLWFYSGLDSHRHFLQSPNLSDFAFSVLHFSVCGPLHQDFLLSQLHMTLCSACLWAISQPTYSDLNPEFKIWDHQMSFLHFSPWACLVLSGVFSRAFSLRIGTIKHLAIGWRLLKLWLAIFQSRQEPVTC